MIASRRAPGCPTSRGSEARTMKKLEKIFRAVRFSPLPNRRSSSCFLPQIGTTPLSHCAVTRRFRGNGVRIWRGFRGRAQRRSPTVKPNAKARNGIDAIRRSFSSFHKGSEPCSRRRVTQQALFNPSSRARSACTSNPKTLRRVERKTESDVQLSDGSQSNDNRPGGSYLVANGRQFAVSRKLVDGIFFAR